MRLTGPLSKDQKARLCILAREAYALAFTPLEFAEWRHAAQLAAVGKSSLRDCVQDDYLALRAAFERLGGEPGEALRTEQRHATEPKRIALSKLTEACHERRLAYPAYPAAIARHQFRCELAQCEPGQIWNLIYTVRSRRKPVKSPTK